MDKAELDLKQLKQQQNNLRIIKIYLLAVTVIGIGFFYLMLNLIYV